MLADDSAGSTGFFGFQTRAIRAYVLSGEAIRRPDLHLDPAPAAAMLETAAAAYRALGYGLTGEEQADVSRRVLNHAIMLDARYRAEGRPLPGAPGGPRHPHENRLWKWLKHRAARIAKRLYRHSGVLRNVNSGVLLEELQREVDYFRNQLGNLSPYDRHQAVIARHHRHFLQYPGIPKDQRRPEATKGARIALEHVSRQVLDEGRGDQGAAHNLWRGEDVPALPPGRAIRDVYLGCNSRGRPLIRRLLTGDLSASQIRDRAAEVCRREDAGFEAKLTPKHPQPHPAYNPLPGLYRTPISVEAVRRALPALGQQARIQALGRDARDSAEYLLPIASDREIAFALDDMATRLWPRSENLSTQATHRARARAALEEADRGGVGLNIVVVGNVVLMRRAGRRLTGDLAAKARTLKPTLTAEAQAELDRYRERPRRVLVLPAGMAGMRGEGKVGLTTEGERAEAYIRAVAGRGGREDLERVVNAVGCSFEPIASDPFFAEDGSQHIGYWAGVLSDEAAEGSPARALGETLTALHESTHGDDGSLARGFDTFFAHPGAAEGCDTGVLAAIRAQLANCETPLQGLQALSQVRLRLTGGNTKPLPGRHISSIAPLMRTEGRKGKVAVSTRRPTGGVRRVVSRPPDPGSNPPAAPSPSYAELSGR